MITLITKTRKPLILDTEELLYNYIKKNICRIINRITPEMIKMLNFNSDLTFHNSKELKQYIKKCIGHKRGTHFNIKFLNIIGYTDKEANELIFNNNLKKKAHVTKMSEEEQNLYYRKRSQRCNEFYTSRGYSEEEAIIKVKEFQSAAGKLASHEPETNINHVVYWINKGYTEEEAKIIISEKNKKASKRCIEYWTSRGFSEEEAVQQRYNYQSEAGLQQGPRDPLRNPKHVDYWINKGYSIEESKDIISRSQVTFSLEICIEKYGDEEGYRIWKERQDKWQETLNSKSEEELIEINFKRGRDKNGVPHIGVYNENAIINSGISEKPCVLYYVRFYNDDFEFYKIGISIFNVKKRFGNKLTFYKNHNLIYNVIEEKQLTLLECFRKEQEILKQYKSNRINIDYNKFKTTEAFDKNVLNIN